MKFRYTALWLAAACIIVFILQTIFGTDIFVLDNAVKFQEPWRLLTALFAHGSIAHLLSNLFGLLVFGLVLEGRIGPKRLFWLFMASGIIINIFSPYPRSLGASGAIYSILGALAVLRPKMAVWVSGMPMPMIAAGLLWLFQDTIGLFVPSNVANIAHLSGLFIGAGIGLFWRGQFADRKKEKPQKDRELDAALDSWERKQGLRK